MVEGKIYSRVDFTRFMLSRLRYSKKEIEDWEKDNRGESTLQVHLVCGTYMRCIWCQIPPDSLEYFRSMDKAQSTVLAMVWEQELKDRIASGQPA